MLVAAGLVPLRWVPVPEETNVLYPPVPVLVVSATVPSGFLQMSGIWKPEILLAAHGGEVGLTCGLTCSRIASVPAASPVAGAVFVALPITNLQGVAPPQVGMVAVPAPAIVV